jgi:hypothetical protein
MSLAVALVSANQGNAETFTTAVSTRFTQVFYMDRMSEHDCGELIRIQRQ